MFATDFSFKFSSIEDLVTKREIREEQRGRSFIFLSFLLGRFKFTGSNL